MFRTGAGCRYGSIQDFRAARLRGRSFGLLFRRSRECSGGSEDRQRREKSRAGSAHTSGGVQLEPNVNQPYSEYTVKVEAEGYSPVEVTGSELLSGQSSVQPVEMDELTPDAFQDIAIPDHTLFGDYPEKIPEAEIKPMDETGEIVLSRVVVPEYVVCMTAPRRIPRPKIIM